MNTSGFGLEDLGKKGTWRATALALLLGVSATVALADTPTFTPKGDDFKGTTLDLSKWHVTVLGDGQNQSGTLTVKDGTLTIAVGGSDFLNATDNGIFIWQPVNGDFQATLEMRSMAPTSDDYAAPTGDPTSGAGGQKLGLMVRTSTDNHDQCAFGFAMLKGFHVTSRTDLGANAGPSSSNRVAFGDGMGNVGGASYLLRLTRKGNTITYDLSTDGGKTFGSLHTSGHVAQDTVTVNLPDDVLVGIATGSHNQNQVSNTVVGPFQITQTATRPTGKGLLAATATDANGAPVLGSALIVMQGTNAIADSLSAGASDTASFFLPPGVYSISTPDTDKNSASTPVPFEIKTAAQVLELKVPVGAAK